MKCDICNSPNMEKIRELQKPGALFNVYECRHCGSQVAILNESEVSHNENHWRGPANCIVSQGPGRI